ncbi:MAG: hypothetical protein H8E57_07270 [Candidatus Cloacimonetes bacterium]|nr:hypothetical protein [Candidatus Cloacimonadota bacterium]
MITYKQKLLDEIIQLPEQQLRKLYLIFQIFIKDFTLKKDTVSNWKEDFSSISAWETDNFNEIQKGLKKWKIEEF